MICGRRWLSKPGHRGEYVINRNPLRRECRELRRTCGDLLACFLSCTQGRGCGVCLAFPAPLCPGNLSGCANGRLDQNRPLLELSPLRPKAREPVAERGTAPVSSSTRTVGRA